MKFSLVVYAPPYSAEAAMTAWRFARAALDEGHEIYRLFFFSDGVHNTSGLAIAAQDELDLPRQWHDLIQQNELDSVACVSSAIKRGILNRQEADRHEMEVANIRESSEIGGLGQLIDACLVSDRVLHFG